jgi:hypothetical protein
LHLRRLFSATYYLSCFFSVLCQITETIPCWASVVVSAIDDPLVHLKLHSLAEAIPRLPILAPHYTRQHQPLLVTCSGASRPFFSACNEKCSDDNAHRESLLSYIRKTL